MNTPDGLTFDIVEYIETATITELEWCIKEMVKELAKNTKTL
tara:strand:- start:4345 stop:4470 length:126 start_codon:yes stop_codon:yes gene_type:complete